MSINDSAKPAKSLTHIAVEKQLDAMPWPRYEVGIFDMAADTMHTRTYDRDTLLRSIGYLRQRNVNGCNIYIRPAGEHQYSLVDDLNAESVKALSQRGSPPPRSSRRVRATSRRG